MRIVTYTCSSCGTIISANELEDNRVMKCPGLTCDEVIRFENLPERDRNSLFGELDKHDLKP